MFVRASLYKRREENQLDATECFIALIICSTCFGHLYAHHQELETVLVLLPHMVYNTLVAGGEVARAASLIPDAYPPALHLTGDHQQAEAQLQPATRIPLQPNHTETPTQHTTNVVIQQNSRKLLMMDILMSETF